MGRHAVTDEQVLHAMGIDDAYHVERVLAKNATGTTELVTIDGAGPFVRKKIATKYARRAVWASLLDCASLRLPQVVATYELPDSFVVVYDYVPGASVKESIESAGPMEGSETASVVKDICEAAQVLHEHGIIHRDISPGNIVLAADGAHLIDLGIARMRNESATRDTTSLGTYGFASPEQYGFAQTDARSDVYSIGCLLGYLLTGLSSDKDGYEEALEKLEPKYPSLYQAIKKACAFEPSARYQSAAELAGALSTEKQSTQSKVPSWEAVDSDADEQGRAQSRLPLILIGIACAVLVGLLAFYFLAMHPQSNGGAERTQTETATTSLYSVTTTSAPSVSANTLAPDGAVAETDIADSFDVGSIGWSRGQDGYIHYALTLASKDDVIYEYPELEVTAKDEAGNILFVDTPYLSVAGANQTIAYSGIQLVDTLPASIECKVVSGLATAAIKGQALAVYSTQNVNVSATASGVRVTGEILLAQSGTYQSSMDGVLVTVLLKDENGAILGGETTTAIRPSAGTLTPFDMSVVGTSNYAAYEIYVYES